MKIRWLIRNGAGRIETGQPFMGKKVESIHRFGDIVRVKFVNSGGVQRPPLTIDMSEIRDIGAE